MAVYTSKIVQPSSETEYTYQLKIIRSSSPSANTTGITIRYVNATMEQSQSTLTWDDLNAGVTITMHSGFFSIDNITKPAAMIITEGNINTLLSTYNTGGFLSPRTWHAALYMSSNATISLG